MTRGHALSELPKNLFQKGREPAAALTAAQAAKRETRCRATALLEVKAMKLCEVMANVLEATVHYAEKKQVQTFEELEREREDEQRAVEVELKEDSDKEDDIYNPWKIPLGWDGKPLPVWLYKLHGLNIEYKCEVRELRFGRSAAEGPRPALGSETALALRSRRSAARRPTGAGGRLRRTSTSGRTSTASRPSASGCPRSFTKSRASPRPGRCGRRSSSATRAGSCQR